MFLCFSRASIERRRKNEIKNFSDLHPYLRIRAIRYPPAPLCGMTERKKTGEVSASVEASLFHTYASTIISNPNIYAQKRRIVKNLCLGI